MGNSAIGRGTAIEENKVKASSADATPDFLDGKVGNSLKVASNLLEIGVTGEAAEDSLFFDGTDWVTAGAKEKIKVITSARDLSLATGQVAYTGVGFRPSFIQAHGAINTSTTVSIGHNDDPTGGSVSQSSSGTWSRSVGAGSNILNAIVSGGNSVEAQLVSFDADGFTINWQKAGSPTGTFNFTVACFR